MTDYSSYFGGTSTGGSTSGGAYSGYFTGTTKKKPKSSGGGGGFFDDIGGALSGVAHFGEDAARGFYNVGHAAVRDVANHPYSIAAGPLAPLAASGISLLEGGGGGHLAHDVAIPIARSYAQKYGPIFEHPLAGKSYAGVRKDPFGTALDALTLATAPFTGGESAILRSATLGERLGLLGEESRLARLADRVEAARAPLEREVETVKGSGQTAKYSAQAARSPLGRIIQKHLTLPLRESSPIAHLPLIGAAREPIKAYRAERSLAEAGTARSAAEYERSLTSLNRSEQQAIHIAAEAPRNLPASEWRADRVRFYQEQLAKATTKGEKADLRRTLRNLGEGNPRLARKIDEALAKPSERLMRSYEGARALSQHSAEAAGFKAETSTERSFLPADIMGQGGASRGAVAEGEAEHPFGSPFVFAHRGPQMPRTNTAGIRSTSMPLGDIQRTAAQHLNQGIRLAAGRLFTSPSVVTHDYLSNLRWESAHHFQDWVGQYAIAIPEAHGIPPSGWVKFNPEGIRGNRALLERGAYEGADTAAGEQGLDEAIKSMFGTTTPDRPMMVPASYAKAVQQEFARSSKVARYLVDKPMDVWRSAVLKYRPAWLINNIVGNHMLYFLHAGGPAALVNYMRMLRVERGEGYAQNVLLRALKVPALRFKYLHLIDETGAHGVRVGTTHGIIGEADRYYSTRRGKLSEAYPRSYSTARHLKGVANSIGRATTRLNQLVADDIPRSAKFVTELQRAGALRRIQKVGREIDDSVSLIRRLRGPSTEDLLRGATDEERIAALGKTNQALGDFNAITPFERRVLRRYVPFVAWLHVMGAITKDLVIHHPEKVNLLRNLETAANENPDLMPKGQLPSWLQGAIALGAPNKGVQEMLTAVGLNPFATPVQIGKAAVSPFVPGGEASDSLGLLGPGFQAYELFQGHDPLTGGDYTGGGSGLPPALRAAVGVGTGLPQIRLAQGLGYLPGYKPAKTYQQNKTDLIYQYLGIPRRHVILSKAQEYGREGL